MKDLRYVSSVRGHYLVDGELGPRPLYMCLGDPRGCEQATRSYAALAGINAPDVVDVFVGI